MKRFISFLAMFGLLLALPAGAAAHKKGHHKHHRAKQLRAAIEPVGTDAAYAGIEGRARLVTNKRRSKLVIHMRGLTRKVVYPWHLHVAPEGVEDPCAEGAAQGPVAEEFRYRRLKANGSGRANSHAKSRTFTFDRTKTYYVNVHDPSSGAPIACGVLERKARKGRKGKRGKRHERGERQERGERGKSRERGERRERGKSRERGGRPDRD